MLYRSIFDLVRDFLKDEAFNQQDKTLRRYLKPGAWSSTIWPQTTAKNSGEYLFRVVMRRYENSVHHHDQQQAIEEWGKLLGDVPTAGAILDRFLHSRYSIDIFLPTLMDTCLLRSFYYRLNKALNGLGGGTPPERKHNVSLHYKIAFF